MQAKAQFQIADQHLAALQSVGKPQTTKSAAGQLTSARGKYEGAAAQLGYTEIRSPIDGVVTERPGYPGETPPPGVPILTVMDTSSVIAKVHIPQEQAALLKVGDAATISGRDTSAAGEQGSRSSVLRLTPIAQLSRCGWKQKTRQGRFAQARPFKLKLWHEGSARCDHDSSRGPV